MAYGAFHTIGGMRAGFPLVIDRLVAGGACIPGWYQPVDDMLGLLLLSHGGLDGGGKNERSEKGGTEQTHAETIHGQTPEQMPKYRPANGRQSVIPITSDRNAICALAARPFGKGMFTNLA
jgi:hypothetical protein